MTTLHLLLLSLCIISTLAQMPCKINVKFRSNTDNLVQVDMIVPGAEIKMEPFIFDHKDQNKAVMIDGEDCEKKHWLLRTWKIVDDEWVLAKKIKMKLFGLGGWIRVLIKDDYTPVLADRNGVGCADGACGR